MTTDSMLKHCPKCDQDKPLTAEFWLPRKDSRDGYRGYCRLCWYVQQRPNKRRHYAKHAERIRAVRRADRHRNPGRRRLIDLRYYLKNRERKLAYNHRYYWLNHERILRQKRWYCTHVRPLRIDLGPEMPNDRNVDMYIWQRQAEQAQARQLASAILMLTMQALTETERRLLMAFDANDFNLDAAAGALKMSPMEAHRIMRGIRNAATRAKTVVTA
jgi:hypothetical protein